MQLPRISQPLFESFKVYGKATFSYQGPFNYPCSGGPMGWIGPCPNLSEDQIDITGNMTAPAHAWIMKLDIEAKTGESLSCLASKLMTVGFLVPGSYSYIHHPKTSVKIIKIIDISVYSLRPGDIIIRTDEGEDEKFCTVSREGTEEVDDKTKYEFTFSVSYPLLEKMGDKLHEILIEFQLMTSLVEGSM